MNFGKSILDKINSFIDVYSVKFIPIKLRQVAGYALLDYDAYMKEVAGKGVTEEVNDAIRNMGVNVTIDPYVTKDNHELIMYVLNWKKDRLKEDDNLEDIEKAIRAFGKIETK